MIANMLAMLLSVGIAQDSTAAKPAIDAEALAHIDAAVTAIKASDDTRADGEIDQAIAFYDKLYAPEKRRIYCGMNDVETLLYMTMAAKDKKDAIAVSPGWCEALFLKGYVRVDAGQLDAARQYYERVIALAPMHWQYLAELGFTYRDSDPAKSLDLYQQAESYITFLDKSEQPDAFAKARHGQGYALSELKRFDEAEAIYKQCLKDNPDDAIAQHELGYIADQRAKMPAASATK
jgi:tetratricopeptide (TPR) repeat protein